MSGFTDYHAHFIYGVDDGAQTREEMYAMLDAAAADGVRHLFATSHSTPGMERFPQEVYDRHLAFARDYCAQKGYDLKLEHGSELLYTPAAGYAAVQRQLLTLGDTGWVLLEFVPNITAKELETALQEITGAGYRILVAHIERYPCLAQHGLLARLHEQYRLRCQINCSAVLDSGFCSGCGWSTGSRRGWWTRSLRMRTTAPRALPECGRRMSGSAPVWDKRQHKN